MQLIWCDFENTATRYFNPLAHGVGFVPAFAFIALSPAWE
jgi:hypothetical protein